MRNTNWYDQFIIYQWLHYYFPPNNYLFNVINKNTRTWCKICPKLTIKTSERRQLWTYFTPCSGVSVIDLEQLITSGVISFKQIVLYVGWTSEDRSYLISQEIETKQSSCRAWRVLVHLIDSWWFCLVLNGFGQSQIILWFMLLIWFIFPNYIRTI